MMTPNPSFRLEHTLTQRDFDQFAEISGDDNPIHVDPDFSARTGFGRTVSHGMLLYTVLWGLVQRHFPGASQLSQSLMFPAPAYAGEALCFEITVMTAEGPRRSLATRVARAGDGTVVCEGTTEIQLAQGEAR